MSDCDKMTADEFYGGIWWVLDGSGKVRNATPGECAAEIQRLRAGIQAILDGDYPNPRDHRPGKCEHGIYYWEPCEQCLDSALLAILNGAASHV